MLQVVEEINLLKKFSNPHIIRFIEAFENPGEVIESPPRELNWELNLKVILIMEYLDGGELFERVADEDFNLTESDCCLFMRQICRGVQYLHDHNIVHLDLKVIDLEPQLKMIMIDPEHWLKMIMMSESSYQGWTNHTRPKAFVNPDIKDHHLVFVNCFYWKRNTLRL